MQKCSAFIACLIIPDMNVASKILADAIKKENEKNLQLQKENIGVVSPDPPNLNELAPLQSDGIDLVDDFLQDDLKNYMSKKLETGEAIPESDDDEVPAKGKKKSEIL